MTRPPIEGRRLNLREAVRALLLDDDGHLLLVRYEFPTATVWGLAGGGLEPGEDDIAGLRRELREELGLTERWHVYFASGGLPRIKDSGCCSR